MLFAGELVLLLVWVWGFVGCGGLVVLISVLCGGFWWFCLAVWFSEFGPSGVC